MAASAIKSMTPLVDTMRVEGKSVCLSPEGTRAISPKLAPFKKGAFHLAMQAGVPVVPIVIHNSGDVQPKGDMLFHPGTVEVEVLPTCRELGIAFVAYSPLGRGFLTGAIPNKDVLDADDFRRSNPRFSDEALAENARFVELIREIAAKKNSTEAQVALAEFR